MTSDKSYGGWYFLGLVLFSYVVTFFVNSKLIYSALKFSKNIFIQILPVILIIFLLMSLTNYFLQPKILVKYLGKNSGLKGWIISIIAGILSTGPIYMWYPLLNDLQKHGMRSGLISAFLYNRAVKIPLIPLLVVYFGLVYTLILLFTMICISIVQGFLTEKIMEIIR